jgi:hypothetical protein
MVGEPPLTLMALVAQNVWCSAPALSSSSRILAWVSMAVFFNAAATAVPRSAQFLIALALLRSGWSLKWIQKSTASVASSCFARSG